MMKTMVFFRIAGAVPAAADLASMANACEFAPCEPTQVQSSGFVPPSDDSSLLARSVDDHLVMKRMVEVRKVPAEIVKRELEFRLDVIQEQTGRRPRGRAAREIKEEVVHSLLPRAFPHRSAHLIWIDTAERTICFESTGQALDGALATMAKLMPGARIEPIMVNLPPALAMANWLFDDDSAPAGFTIGRECELRQPDGEKATVRYTRHNIDADEVSQHIRQGKRPTKLAMSHGDAAHFVLTDSMVLRKVEINTVDDGGSEDAFSADIAIMAGTMRAAFKDLVAALGGEIETESEGSDPA